MKQKKVTLKIAKAIKEAGYPQRLTSSFGWYNGELQVNESCYDLPLDLEQAECVAPTYLDVWLWLETEKKIIIHPNSTDINDSDIKYATTTHLIESNTSISTAFIYNNSEEAIVDAIAYLIDNNLIK